MKRFLCWLLSHDMRLTGMLHCYRPDGNRDHTTGPAIRQCLRCGGWTLGISRMYYDRPAPTPDAYFTDHLTIRIGH